MINLPDGCPVEAVWSPEYGLCSEGAVPPDATNCTEIEIHPKGTRKALVRSSANLTGSDYDRAVEALAPYLPDGWVAQDAGTGPLSVRSALIWYWAKPRIEGEQWVTGAEFHRANLNVPRLEDWKSSLRRVVAGRVVDNRGEGADA